MGMEIGKRDENLTEWILLNDKTELFTSFLILINSTVSDQQRPEYIAEREAGDAMERHEGRNGGSHQGNDRYDLRGGCSFLWTGRLVLRWSHSRSIPQHTHD